MTIVIRSEAQRQLIDLPQTDREIAAGVGVSNIGRVQSWREGGRTPGPVVRTKLNQLYGIRPRTWYERPHAPGANTAPEPGSVPDTLAHCLELLAAVRQERRNEETLPAQRVKLAAAEARILEMRHKLEMQAQLSEDRYVREHPAFKRHIALIVDALREHPLAARAVMHALEREGIEPL